MTDLLTAEEERVARSQGWFLSYVFDLRKDRWVIAILAAPGGPFAGAYAASQSVVEQARRRDVLALRALRLVLQGPVQKPPRRKK